VQLSSAKVKQFLFKIYCHFVMKKIIKIYRRPDAQPNDTQPNDAQYRVSLSQVSHFLIAMLSDFMLIFIILSAEFLHYSVIVSTIYM
jgi:hypothetical protein